MKEELYKSVKSLHDCNVEKNRNKPSLFFKKHHQLL